MAMGGSGRERDDGRGGAQAGFTLVEVLVALVVVALGAAGAAGLHARALQATREAARLSDAVQVANALAARMRANRAVMDGDDGANPYLHYDTGAGAGGAQPAAPCFAAGCDAPALARFDLSETAADLAARLPGGRIAACRDGATPDAATGLPAWNCDGASEAAVVVKVGWRTPGAPDRPRVVLPLGALR
jgi:type IV pilus assembly protein PilV